MALSPLGWALETQSCAEPNRGPHELRGLDLFNQIDPDDMLFFVVPLVLVVGIPFLAWRAPTLATRMLAHVTSLVAAVWGSALLVAFVTFTIFATRVVRPAGYLVVVLGALPVIEAVTRIVLGVREIRASRAPRAQAEPLPSVEPAAPEP